MQRNYFVSEKSRKREFRIKLVLFFAIMMMLCAPMQQVYAYGSWVTNPASDSMYGGLEAQDKVNEMENSEEDAHSHILLNFLIKIPDGITNALQGSSNSQYNFSIDGIILGRLAAGSTVNYTGFDFGNNNPWSSIGAVIYRSLRNACLGGMMFVYLVILAKNIVMTGEKARTYLKEYLSTMVFMFVLIYIMPQLLDMVIYWRDTILKLVHDGLYSSGIASASSTSIIEEYRSIAVNEMNTFNVLLYMGASISTVWYLLSYLKIAMIQAMLFGIFPLIAVLSIQNRKLIHDWFWMFIGNVMVPFFDFIILLMPIVVNNTISTNKILKALIKLFIIMSAIPARNAVLRLISLHSGQGIGGGFGAFAGLGMTALNAGRNMLRGAKNNAGNLANRESDLEKSDGANSPDMKSAFEDDVKQMQGIVGSSAGVDADASAGAFASASADGYEDGHDDENSSAFEKSQDAVEGMVGGADTQTEDETDLTGHTDAGEPDMPGYEGVETDEFAPQDQTGLPGTDFDTIPIPETGVADGEDSRTSADNLTQTEVENLNNATLAERSGSSDGQTSETGSQTIDNTSELAKADGVNVPDGEGSHGANGNGADKDLDMTGLTAKSSLPEVGDTAGHGNVVSMQDYNEPEQLSKFNDARFKNLQALDGANERLSALKTQESGLEASRANHATAYAEAKENLNAVRQETNLAVNTANHEVEVTSRNLQNAQQEQIRATENKAAMDNNAHASHEQRAVADARLNTANENVRKAQEASDQAVAKQKTAVDDRKEKMAAANERVAESKQALDNAQKKMENNANGQRTENARIMQAKQNEEKFRNISQTYGMSNRSYTNADDFRRQRMVDSQKRALANYKNFDSGSFKNTLSPEERSQFQRQRELQANRNKKIEMAKNIAMGNVTDAWNTAETTKGKMIGAGGALIGKAAQSAAKTAAFGAGAVVGAFGGVGGAAVVGTAASKLVGKNTAAIDFAATQAQSVEQPENPYKPGSKFPGYDESLQQAAKQPQPTRKAAGKGSNGQVNSKTVITQNAKSAMQDPDIGKIVK